MIFLVRIFVFLSLCSTLLSCKKSILKSNTSEFTKIYDQLLDDGKTEKVTLDTEVHSYTFILSEDKNLKSIGYQSHSNLSTTNYEIEIIRDSDSSVVYSNVHQFSSTSISYVSLTTPLSLQNGVSFTVRRIQSNWLPDISNTIGHVIKTEQTDYPLHYGTMKITKTQFHDKQTLNPSLDYFALPRIDLVFE